MIPGDRIEARVLACDIEEVLKWEILNSLKWYRMALYKATQENERLEKSISAERWKTAICTGSY